MSESKKKEVKKNFKALGIKSGSVVLLRASLSKVGNISRKDFVDALLEVIGEEGTLVALGFSEAFRSRKHPKFSEHVFHPLHTPPNIGGLSAEIFSRSDCFRSRHPTNSFLAIGKYAQYVVEGHNENSLCYTPMQRIIELKGIMALVGCVDTSPGFTTVHYCQELLGITKQSRMAGIYSSQYEKTDGSVALFVKNDVGGCSMGFANFYKHYRDAGALVEGSVGDADSIAITAQDAFDIEMRMLERNRHCFICNNWACASCRLSWPFYFLGPFEYALGQLKKLIKV